MLKIINDLTLFFEDNYRRINVREYARLQKISPPTASKLLEHYKSENLLKKEEDKQYYYYYTNKESATFTHLLQTYWQLRLNALLNKLEDELVSPIIILYGSLAKAEAKLESDIDLAVFTPSKKEINLKLFETKLKRKIQIFTFKNRKEIKNKHLLNNILNGVKLRGTW